MGVFHFGRLPFWSSSILIVPSRTAQRSYPPAQINGPILPHSSTVLLSRTAQRSYPPAQLNRGEGGKILYLEEQKGGPQKERHTDGRNCSLLKFTSVYAGKLENWENMILVYKI